MTSKTTEAASTMNANRRLLIIGLAQLSLFACYVSYNSTFAGYGGMMPGGRSLSLDPAAVVLHDATTSSHTNNNTLVEKVALVHPKPKHYGPPQIAWLLSFPNR